MLRFKLFAVFFLMVVPHAFADERAKADIVLANAKSLLLKCIDRGMVAPGRELLSLIQAAEDAGALSQSISAIGVHPLTAYMVSYGSTSDGWRIQGHVPKTSVALSISIQYTQAGASVIRVTVVLPAVRTFFGTRSSEFEAVLFQIPEQGGRLRVTSPETQERISTQKGTGDQPNIVEEIFHIERHYSFPQGQRFEMLDWQHYIQKPGICEKTLSNGNKIMTY